ncbi:MAG TPA: LysM peptidoglycan-binding domain-containing protein, partial [Candidatus Diapherotrites archaeon]|nr:LysM peptidoglycan-binding domain-containing protein [Candidatus Diapherotrites archaeon]
MLIHVVKPRETLWQIANRYRVSTASIAEVNGLPDPNRLVVGQALVIPTEDIFHTVLPGETLWKIAQTYGTTIQAILQNNQIANPNNIYPGLVLYIPALRYRIQPGDTLWSVAQRFGVALNSLIKVNNIENVNLVYPGTVLVIPRKPRPAIDVNGYIYILGQAAVPIIEEVGEHLTYLSPFAYLIREDGNLQAIDDIPAIQAAKSYDAIPMMSITNFTSTALGENLAHVVLNSPTVIERLLANVINIMKEKGYSGLNVDFENVLPADREPYNRFLQQAVTR